MLELVGDLGSGKTVFVRGLAEGIGSKDSVASPTFTISRVYRAKQCDLHHYDFYRLSEPGIVKAELAESVSNPRVAVAVEWSQIVKDVLPDDRLKVEFMTLSTNKRRLTFNAGPKHTGLLAELK